jgi:hypothetical protein
MRILQEYVDLTAQVKHFNTFVNASFVSFPTYCEKLSALL